MYKQYIQLASSEKKNLAPPLCTTTTSITKIKKAMKMAVHRFGDEVNSRIPQKN